MSKEKYSVVETENAYYIADNDEDVLLNVAVVVNRLNNYEHRLANCIEPKFIVGQKIYVIGTENVEEVEYFGENVDGIITFEEGCRCGCTPDRYSVEKRENVFASESEAKNHLEELKNVIN